MEDLLRAIQTTPIIDHHAHNLLLPSDIGKHDLLSLTSEASGATLEQGAPSTLAHLRAVHQLAAILECEPNWTAVKTAIEQKRKEPNDAWARRCFQGIETVLIDDGLDPSNVHPYEWHDRLTRSKCKRIVRIERVAEAIMTNAFEEFSKVAFDQRDAFVHHVVKYFTTAIQKAIADPDVAGFKSVICYRMGLAIPKHNDDYKHVLGAIFQSKNVKRLSRLEDELLNPYFVHLTAKLIEGSVKKKPFQFHTGLGDNDINLELSNPAHLQDFIKTYPKVPIVLLHASYPFTTEAGYLASVYSNVWLDIGEVFPFLSQDGQETVIRNALDLCPSEKMMWSTDGHWFPESYLLAVVQAREGLRTVLCDYVKRDALTVIEAVKIIQDIFFNTSNRLYDLGLPLSLILPIYPSDSTPEESVTSWDINLSHLNSFLKEHPSVRYLRLQWMDFTSTLRVRVLPIKQALDMIPHRNLVSIIQGVLGLLQNDYLCPGFSATFVYNLYPIFQSLRLSSRDGHASLQCEFQEENGDEVLKCPRTVLRKQVEMAGTHDMNFLVGFEIEVVFMRSFVVEGGFRYGDRPVNDGGHAYSTARALQRDDIMDLLETIHAKMERAGIELLQFHTEASSGQYEFVVGPLPPLEAVDTLLAAREIICSTAANAELRATLHPKPSPRGVGTGAHMHLSFTPTDQWQAFYAGILRHLKAIVAFTYPNDASYERVADGTWSGGTWIAWGTQNKETPLRRIGGSRFEIKCMDGFSNPYLALAAMIGAGLQGVVDEEPLTMKDCVPDPSTLSLEERAYLGIREQFPKSIDEALSCLATDDELCRILGKPAVDSYMTIKRTESEMMKRMNPDLRRHWLIERY